MRLYSVKSILLLSFILCSKWPDIVDGQVNEQPFTRGPALTTRTQLQNSTSVPLRTVTTTPKPEQEISVARLLSSVIQKLTEATRKRFVMFDASYEEVVEIVKSLLGSSNEERCDSSDDTALRCKLLGNNMYVQIVTDTPHVYVTVNLDTNSGTDPLADIKNFCHEKFPDPTCAVPMCTPAKCTRQPTTCPPITCETEPKVKCPNNLNECFTKAFILDQCKAYFGSTTDKPMKTDKGTTTNSQGSPCDMKGQITQPTECDGLLPIIVACIVSFIAGVGICLLAFCLIGHFRGRLCLNFTNSSKDVENTGKSPGATAYMSPQLKTNRGTSNKDHEYLDLQNVDLQYPTGARTPGQDKLNKPMDTAPLPMYETIAHAADTRVYNGLEHLGSNPTNLYDQTSANRSSEHVYSGIQDEKKPSGHPALQHQESPTNARVDQSYINLELKPDGMYDNKGLDTDEHTSQQNDYFILAKEDHQENNTEPELDAETPDDNDDYHSYHTLEKV